MNHPSTCLPRESGIQGCRSRLLESSPIALLVLSPSPPSLFLFRSRFLHLSLSASPSHYPSFYLHHPRHQLTTVVWYDLPKADGVALRIRRHAPYLEARERERRREVATVRDGERERKRETGRERERENSSREGEKGRSYVDTEAALESLNVIRLKGF